MPTRFAALALAVLAILGLLAPGAARAEKVRAAFVLLETIDDQGWTTCHYDGIKKLQQALGDRVEVAYTEGIGSAADAERVIRGYATQDYDIIFGTTFTYMDAMFKVAQDFPKVKFEHCSGYKTRQNMGTYFVRMYQGEYLAGYLAGLMGFKNVGTVATQPLPEVVRGVNAFTIGLLKGLAESRTAHDPAKVNTVVWLKSWRDAVNETTLAQTLAAMGHDLIRQMADTCDSSKAACRMGVPAMGYGADAAEYGADCVLVSTVFDWGSIYIDRVRAILDGTWKAEAVWNGFDKGGVSLSRFNASVPKEAAAKVLAQKDQLAKGRDDIFAGPLSDQSGKVRIAAGQKASDQDLLAMRWFVTGVSGRIPD